MDNAFVGSYGGDSHLVNRLSIVAKQLQDIYYIQNTIDKFKLKMAKTYYVISLHLVITV